MKRITYKKAARLALKRMPANTARLITDKIGAYAADPASQRNNVKALKGSTDIRLRVGNWRVIMDDRGTVLVIERIAPRGSAYKR